MWVIQVVFWLALGLIVYTMIGYPILALGLGAIVRRDVHKAPIEPSVSFIIAAYNEEAVIGEKLRQTLALDYPRERLELIVASDGSTDGTDEIVRSFAEQGVILYRGPGRQGKTATLNGAVDSAGGEIVVFSDATGRYSSQAIRELAAHFNDPSVGCVTGRVAYRYGDDVTSRGFRWYQRFAVGIRNAETRFGSQTSVSGSIHALRRELFRPGAPEHSADVVDAVNTVAQGRRVVYARQAVSYEQARSSVRDEYRCRVRIGVRNTAVTPYVLSRLMRSGALGYLFQMISHKFLRWWLWLWLLTLAITNAVLVGQGTVYAVLAAAQGAFYCLALGGLAAARYGVTVRFVSSMSFFVVANAAMCVGVFEWLRGRRMPRWEPVR